MRIRRTRKIWYVALGVFVAVFLFTFLSQRVQKDEVDAASLASFDPGYIMSDYQMSNYRSMSESEIQSFLSSKVSCDKDTSYYNYLVANYPGFSWHLKNGHIVCLPEERFGNGETIGSGDTAAHIIWQAAQDYRINPQVLIVLLQKEQGLVTDKYPNTRQYRAATGYGCPDTAECSSKYYGFKNQVRNAAAMFRTVLDGGWTNYPLGNNYVQYNPSASCGGTVVNIRSLATSALYRYTPYQPNAAALSAEYGTGNSCSAYGNRNFYLYFQDWFGGITYGGRLSGSFKNMAVPRVIYVKKGAKYVVPETGELKIRGFSSFEFFTHLNYRNNDLCLSIGDNKNCYLYSDLEELEVAESEEMAVPRMLVIKENARNLNYIDRTLSGGLRAGKGLVFSSKTYVNGELCLKVQKEDTKCVPYSQLEELPNVIFKDMAVPRYFSIKENASMIDVTTGIDSRIKNNGKVFFDQSTTWFGELCLNNSQTMVDSCILYSDLEELDTNDFESMAVPRFLKVSKGAIMYDTELEEANNIFEDEQILLFDRKKEYDGELCLSAYPGMCIKYSNLTEIENFVDMDYPRNITVKARTHYYNWKTFSSDGELIQGRQLYFVDKAYIDGELCLRSDEDARSRKYRCVMYDGLSE